MFLKGPLTSLVKKGKMNISPGHFFILLCFFYSNVSIGQQLSFNNQYYLTPLIYNPALTGTTDQSKLFIAHKARWTSIPGTPVINTLFFDSPLKNKKAALGISIHNEGMGIIQRNGAYGYYSYTAIFSEKNKLKFGIATGIFSNQMNFSKVLVENTNDPFLISAPEKNISVDFNAGLALILNNLEIGFTAFQLTGNGLQKSSYNTFTNAARSYLISTRYLFKLNSQKNISFYPLVLAKITPNAPVQYDVNGIVDWSGIGWVGATYKSDYAIGLNAGIKLFGKLNIGYSYDLITNPIKAYGGLSHEIMLGYIFTDNDKTPKGLEKERKSIIQQIIDFFERSPHKDTKREIDKINKKIEEHNKEVEKLDRQQKGTERKRNKEIF